MNLKGYMDGWQWPCHHALHSCIHHMQVHNTSGLLVIHV